MEFKSIKEMSDYLLHNHNMKIMSKSEYYDNKNKNPGFVFTAEGKKYLNKKGYFSRYDMRLKVGALFNNFKCDNCSGLQPDGSRDNEHCKKCRAVERLIKNM